MVVEDHDGGDDAAGHHEHDAVEVGPCAPTPFTTASAEFRCEAKMFAGKAVLCDFVFYSERFIEIHIFTLHPFSNCSKIKINSLDGICK